MESQTKSSNEELDKAAGDPPADSSVVDSGARGNGGRGPGSFGGGSSGFSLRNLRTLTSFKSGTFRLYFAAMIGQMAAMNMQMIARSLLVFQLTGSGTALGVMALGNALPMLFFSLFGGVIADRVQKKYVLLWGQAGNGVVSLVVAFALVSGLMSEERSGSWILLVIAALFQGTIMGLMMPSRQAMIAEIVGEEDLMNAVALNTFGMNALRLLAPVPVGFMIYVWDYGAVYFAMTAMYAMATFFVALMPKTGTITLQGKGAIQDVKDGLVYVRNEPTLLLILVVTFIVVLLSMPYMMLLPALTEDVLLVDSRGFGVLLSISGIGAMAGSLVLASLPNKRRGLMLMLGSLVLGIALIGLFFSSSWFPSLSWPLALFFIVFVGLGQTTRMTLGNTLLQYYVKEEFRGRVMALYFMEFGLTSFGVFFTGVLTDVIGVQWSVGGLAIILVIFCIFVLIFSPRLRKLD
jgi:MFS family permease